MAINLFNLSHSTAGHMLEVAATFVVLLAAAVAIDWCVRCCHRLGTSPDLVRLLHRAAQCLVVADLTLIGIDVAHAVAGKLV